MTESIELQNYRLFRRAELKGLPPMVTIVGANGSGKSTLFDALTGKEIGREEAILGSITRIATNEAAAWIDEEKLGTKYMPAVLVED